MTKADRNARAPRPGRQPGHTAGHSSSDGGVERGASVSSPSGGDLNRQAACTSLSYLFLRADGWLRATPADGKALWLKWKFTNGDWAGYYVMVRVEVWQWDWGIQLLQDKVEGVDLGVYRPTKDKWYYAGDPSLEDQDTRVIE